MRKMIRAALALGALTLAAPAAAHLGEPTIKRLRFPPERPGETWLLVDNVGLLALADGRWTWLCDEAITPDPGFNDLAPLDPAGAVWIAATRAGLYRTTDAGCSFTRLAETALDYYDHLSPHPGHPGEALVGTVTIGADPNDVYRTTDAGEHWTAAGLALAGRVRGLLRATADPDVVYLLHTHGALRSDDGGQHFTPITLAPPPEAGAPEATGTDIVLLATDPRDPRVIWSAFVRFPDSDLQRSRDGGETWERVAQFSDTPQSLAIDPTTGALTLAMPLEGLRRSTDDGARWDPLFVPEPDAWFDCLTHAADGTLWACARRGAPYLVASATDGEDWVGRFASDYRDIAGPWACPAGSPTAVTCAAACDRSRQNCGGDLGVVDAGVPDAGVGEEADAARADGGEPGEIPVTRADGRCSATPGAGGSDGPLGSLLPLFVGFLPALRAARRRRRRRGGDLTR
ncbi:MAG: hypothetical protein H6705_20410 [Myxococcales bacterium]|nr:hypothetical protein [Myxococcales bacterium]